MSGFVIWLLKWLIFNLQFVCSFCISLGPNLRDGMHLLEVTYTLWESELKIIAASSNKAIGNLSYYSPAEKHIPIMFQSHSVGRYQVLWFNKCVGSLLHKWWAYYSTLRVAYSLNPLGGLLTLNSQPDIHQPTILELSLFPNKPLCSNQATLLTILHRWLANFSTYCSES